MILNWLIRYSLKHKDCHGNNLVIIGRAGFVIMATYPDSIFMGPTWGPPGSCRPQMGPMLAPWTLLSGYNTASDDLITIMTTFVFQFYSFITYEESISQMNHQPWKCMCTTWLMFKLWWPSSTIWWHKSGSTLAQVMPFCLMAPNYWLNQCWLIISKVQWYSFDSNFTRYLHQESLKLDWELLINRFLSNIPGASESSNYMPKWIIVARLREPRDSNVGILENKPTLLTISRLWRYCGPSNYRFNFLLYWYAPWVFF